MKHQSSFQLSTNHNPVWHALTPERGATSLKFSLGRTVREMRSLRMSYQDALRSFQERYIVEVLLSHSCHMGRTAKELGMHPNTLTRTIRDLNIDVRLVRQVHPLSARPLRDFREASSSVGVSG